MPASKRTRLLRRVITISCLLIIMFAPIIAAGRGAHLNLAGWALRNGVLHHTHSGTQLPQNSRELLAVESHRAQFEAYVVGRNNAVDHLLPEGVGGTLFVEDLDENLGIAIPASATIAVALSALPHAEGTELHERAHLLYTAAHTDVARLIRRLPRPTKLEALKNNTEHFAQMAGSAWDILSPVDELCYNGTIIDRLREAEAQVPGTAGFVAWFLENEALQPDDSLRQLAAEAELLSEPVTEEWRAIRSRVDARRQPDGFPQPWERPCVAQLIAEWRSTLLSAGNPFDTLAAVLMLPAQLISVALCVER